MDYNEFLFRAQEDLAAAMPEKVITRETVNKLQGVSYEGLAVRQEGTSVAVMLNMEAMFARMEGGADYRQVLSDMLNIVDNNSVDISQKEMDFISDYNQIRNRLTVDLVGQDLNRDRLKDIPHFDMADLSVVYRIDLTDEMERMDGRTSVLVTNQLLERYGVSPEQLHQDAVENASRQEPAVVRSMGMVLAGMDAMPPLKEEDIPPLLVATNPSMTFGASVVAYPGFMEKAAEQFQGNFFILPSSVHEVLLLKDDGKADYRDLEAMVYQINRTEVEPQERLSDHVYHYDSREKVFELAEKYEART